MLTPHHLYVHCVKSMRVSKTQFFLPSVPPLPVVCESSFFYTIVAPIIKSTLDFFQKIM